MEVRERAVVHLGKRAQPVAMDFELRGGNELAVLVEAQVAHGNAVCLANAAHPGGLLEVALGMRGREGVHLIGRDV